VKHLPEKHRYELDDNDDVAEDGAILFKRSEISPRDSDQARHSFKRAINL